MAQNSLSEYTQVEFGVGYTLPFLNKGIELLRAKELRNKQQSYYSNELGYRNNVGNYTRSAGLNFSISYYKPINILDGLMIGAIVRNSQTASSPEMGGYEESYFFNFITAGIALKYYPFQQNNLFIKSDFGLAAVLTKNRYLNSKNEQDFFHQFGIGSALGIELGYGFTPFKDKTLSLELKSGYQLANTRVEVSNIGDDNWQFGAFYFGTSFIF